jgi:hypothetical protein
MSQEAIVLQSILAMVHPIRLQHKQNGKDILLMGLLVMPIGLTYKTLVRQNIFSGDCR